MKITPLQIPGAFLIAPERFTDSRGYFSETFNQRALEEAGVDAVFVQDNMSLSVRRGTVRGLHYQAPPHAQAKLVRVLAGAVLDVVVDARRGSPTFGRHVALELSARNGLQVYVPEGVLHGFATLEDDTEIAYKVSSYYAPGADGSVRWDDGDLGIPWGLSAETAIVSDKDAAAPLWRDFSSPFDFETAPAETIVDAERHK